MGPERAWWSRMQNSQLDRLGAKRQGTRERKKRATPNGEISVQNTLPNPDSKTNMKKWSAKKDKQHNRSSEEECTTGNTHFIECQTNKLKKKK